ncbi:MAG: RNA polymerase sigma factor [Sedimentisphaerales bacterium]|nr:RNA polymerase sigma factor [Sedimentisphaerales bacterium]
MNSREQLIELMLILRCQMGDKEAFVKLIERYQRPLRYFISRLLDDAQASEDILQDTWLTVIGRISGLKKPEAFSIWLYRIARNKVYQQLRRKKTWSELNENFPAPNENEDEAISLEDVAKIHECLKALRPEHKEVLMLRFLEQMSYQQMTGVLGCNPGTVRSRVYYAKLALKKEMEK